MSTIESDFRIKNGVQVAGNSLVHGTSTVIGNTILLGTNNQLGTVTGGTWNASAISRQFGGFGQDTANLSGYVFFNGAVTTASSTIPASAITGTLSSVSIGWTQVTSRPTTLAGYGITDNVAVRNADGTLTVAVPPQELNQAVNAQYFYDNNFLNFEPKVGKGNDPYVGVSSRFKYSMIEQVGVTIVNEYDQECMYYIASDGQSQPEMFKAHKISTENVWTFAPEPVRPYFLSSTEFITSVHGGSNDWLLVSITNTAPSSTTLVLIRTNDVDSPAGWDRINIPPSTVSANAKFLLAQNRAVDVTQSGNQFVLRMFDTTTWTQIGASRTLFDITTDINYTHPTFVVTSRSVRYMAPLYNPATNNLIVFFAVIGGFTTAGPSSLAIPSFTLSYDIPNSIIDNNTGTITTLIPNSTHAFFGTAALYDGSATFKYSYDAPTSTVFLHWQNFWSGSQMGFAKRIVTTQFTQRSDFVWPSSFVRTPDSSPWSKSVQAVMLFPNNVCVLRGESTLYGFRWIVGEYTISGGTLSIVPGRWRLFDSKPSTAPTNVLDNAVASNFQGISNQIQMCVTFDASNNPLYLHCTGPGQPINQVTIDRTSLTVSVTPYTTVNTPPTLPTGYTAAGNWGYDPKRNIFYFVVRKSGEFNSSRVIARTGAGLWVESPIFNESEANTSRSSFFGTTTGVNASVAPASNILIDQAGNVYVNQSYGVNGDNLAGPINRLTFDGTTFVVERGAQRVSPHISTYTMSYSNEGYSGGRARVGSFRAFTLTQDVDARVAFITGLNSAFSMWVTGSTGLVAFIAAQDVFVAGQWSKMEPTSVTLLPNTTNYIYIRRNTNDVRILEVFTSTRLMRNTFSRVLIGEVTTDSANPVSQILYRVNETTAQWPNISDKPVLTLTGAVTGSVSLDAQNLTMPTTLSQSSLVLNGPPLTGTDILRVNGGAQVNSLGVGTPAPTTVGEIRATNDVTAFFSSDARFKQNIVPIANASDKVSRIRGVEFDWTDEYIASRGGEDPYFVRRRDVGVIAQEIQQVLPEVVSQRADGTLAVKYDRIVSLLIEAFKEMKQEIETLKASR